MNTRESTGRIIIADDVPHVRASLRLMFTAILGLDVVGEASTAQELLALLGTTQADILIVDRNIPGLENPDVVEQIRQHAPESRILLVNVFEREDGVRPCPLKADFTISKSVGPEHWLREIERMLMTRPPGIINLAIEADKHIHEEIEHHAASHGGEHETLRTHHAHRMQQVHERRERYHMRSANRLRRTIISPSINQST